MLQVIEKEKDLTKKEKDFLVESGYVCIDTETTGLNYMNDKLCTIQLFCDEYSIIVRYNSCYDYENLKEVLYSKEVLKVFHNAVFDVSFLMKNLNIPTMNDYINAGVMVMNLKKIRDDKMDKKLKSFVGILTDDQDIINKVFYGKIKLIHPKWNLTLISLRNWVGVDALYPRVVSQEAYNNPAIMHYAGGTKCLF